MSGTSRSRRCIRSVLGARIRETRRVRRRQIVATLGVAAVLTACFGDSSLARQRQQADAALERWEAGAEPPAWDPENPPQGVVPDTVEVSADGRDLLVTFVGSPHPASEPCGEDYTGEAVESDLAVVVIIVRHSRLGPETCTGIGAVRTTTITLAEPLGDRTVLDVQQGMPVEVLR